MADDEDAIFIDVVPKLDEGAADEIEGKLRGKLSHVGDSLKDSLSTAVDSIGDKLGAAGGLGDKLHDMLGGALSGKEWDNLSKQAGTALGQGIDGALKDLTHGNFGGILGDFGKVGDVLSGAVDKLNSKLDGLQKTGGAVGNVLSGNASGNDINDIIGGAKDLGFKIPGPVNDLSKVNDVVNKMNEHPGQTEDWLDKNFGFALKPLDDVINKGPQAAGNWLAENTWASPSPTRDAASDKWSSSVANEVDIQASSATISAGSVSLGGSISLPASMTGGGGISSGGGRTTSSGIAAAGGDSNSMSSLYSSSSVLGKGFDSGGILPGDAPGYDNMIGVLPGGSMVGLEGKEGVVNPRAMSQPGVADLITQLNKGYDDGTMSAAGVGGDSNNPTLSTTPTTPNTAGGNSPVTQQQLGTGSGGGISGGGIIGAAEQAGVAAAGVAGFGGGAIAAQMAVQETNLAVQKTSQSIAALAAAPFETFGLSGGMMGAPQVNPMGGWIGKLIGGELGSQTNLPNLAGASTQPPKQPNPQQPSDQQGQGETPSGPSGSKDDPMHVNVTNQPQAPQGTVTSGMNATPGLTMSVP